MPSGRSEKGASGGAAGRRRRHERQYGETLPLKVKEAGGELLRKAVLNSRRERLRGLVE